MSSAFKLLRLQQVDSQLDHVKSRLAEIERMLANDEVVKQAQITLQEAEQSRETAQKELSRADEEVKAIQAKLKENQEHLYGGKVRNPKELQDLQMEAESLNRHLRALEDSELEKMMALEERQTEAKVADGALEAVRAQRANKLLAEGERLQEERSTNLNSIDERDLKIYDGLRASKGGIAVAKVQNKTCGACGAELSASLAQAARSPNELTRCDNCKRILYAG